MTDALHKLLRARLEPTYRTLRESGAAESIEVDGLTITPDLEITGTTTKSDADVVKSAEIALLDLLPGNTLLQVTETRPLGGGRTHDMWSYYENYGQGRWTALDPGDRYDGENAVESGFIVNLVRAFGEQDVGRGSFVALFVPKKDQR